MDEVTRTRESEPGAAIQVDRVTRRTPEKYRDRLFRAAVHFVERNRLDHAANLAGDRDFLDAVDVVLEEMTTAAADSALIRGAQLTKGEWRVEVDVHGTVTNLRYVRGADEPSRGNPRSPGRKDGP